MPFLIKIFILLTLLSSGASAQRFVFLPHDSRPVSAAQSADILRAAGADIISPDENILGGRDYSGNVERMWAWLEDAAKHKPDAFILSADALIYGSLVDSRIHSLEPSLLEERLERLKRFAADHKRTPVFVFASIMRTPRDGASSGHEEPSYYRSFGADIFRYTALIDKNETDGLNKRQRRELEFLQQLIPKIVLSDWMERRKKNFDINKKLIDGAREGAFEYLLLGRDDNAPHCQTHLESLYLIKYGAGVSNCQSLSGIDEIALILLARAFNSSVNRVPFVFAKYNWGKGADTVPAYSDESIAASIADAVKASGSMLVPSPARADFVIAVNSNPDGLTLDANSVSNDGKPREGTEYFADMVSDYVSKGYAVGVADIAFANGADNALMNALRDRGLLYRLKAYAGWNTATNSAGCALATAQLTPFMNQNAVDRLLTVRYLDDWAYQANVRGIVGRQLTWLRGEGYYGRLGDKQDAVARRAATLLNNFAARNLPPDISSDFAVRFPWNRMFEAEIFAQ